MVKQIRRAFWNIWNNWLILQSGLETRFWVLGTRSSFIESQKFNNNIIIEQAQKIKNREPRTQDRVPSNQERAHSSDGPDANWQSQLGQDADRSVGIRAPDSVSVKA